MSARPARCPVCGKKPVQIMRGNRTHMHCTACGETGPKQSSVDAAIAAWNAIAVKRRNP